MVLGGHAYSQPGSYALKVTVGEASGETDAATGIVVARSGQGADGLGRVPETRAGCATGVGSYDGPVDAARRRTSRRCYLIQLPERKGVFGAKGSRSIRVKVASYDPNTHTVTLTPRSAPPRKGAMRVQIAGEGDVAVGR